MAVVLTGDNFEKEVYEADMPVLVDFYADWCGPCKAMGPVVEVLAGEYEGKVKVGKINIDNYPDIAMQYGVRSIPTFMVFKGREVQKKLIGTQDKKVLAGVLDEAL